MAQDIDAMLQPESEPDPAVPPAERRVQATDSGEPLDAPELQSPEEVEFRALKGPTQDRIRKLIQEKNRMAQDLERLKTMPPAPNPYEGDPKRDPAISDAIRKLREVGVATDETVDQKIQESLSRMRYYTELDRLEQNFTGDDGRPKFDRVEYQDYISRHPEYSGYLPEDVYLKMYREELRDWEGQTGRDTRSSSKPSLRPIKTQIRETAMTPEQIEARLKEPDGPEWYTKNQDKINRAIAQMAPTTD